MRISAIDIGVKSLALTIFDMEKPEDKKCSQCSRKATKENSENVYCTIHGKKQTNTKDIPKKQMPQNIKFVKWEVINLVENEIKEVENRTCSIEGCTNQPKRQSGKGKDKIYYCTKHAKPLTIEHTTMKKRVVTYDNALYAKRIQNIFESYKNDFLSTNLVVIENQSNTLNGKGTSLMNMVYAWFIFNDIPVSLISASSKLKVYCGEDRNELDKKASIGKKGGKLSDYQIRKNQGILHARALLKDDTESIKFLDDHPTKIDDLCDSFLLGCYGSFLV